MYIHLRECSVAQLCPTLCHPWAVATRLLCSWDFPGKNTGVGCHFLGQQRMRWLGSTTDPMEMNLSKLREIVKDKGAWCVAVHAAAESDRIK